MMPVSSKRAPGSYGSVAALVLADLVAVTLALLVVSFPGVLYIIEQIGRSGKGAGRIWGVVLSAVLGVGMVE